MFDRVLADPGEHVSQVSFRVQAVQARRSNQTIEDGRPPSSGIRTSEKIIPSANGHWPQRSLGDQVIDFDAAIIEITRQSIPEAESIVNGSGSLGLRCQLGEGLFHPSSHVVEQWPGPRPTEQRGVRRPIFP